MKTTQNHMENYLEQFEECLQHEPSFCSAACPFNMDVDTFISRLQEGRFNAAYKAYRDATGFPFIAAEICSEKCRESCLRNAVRGGLAGSAQAVGGEPEIRDGKAEGDEPATRSGDPIELLALERATLCYATRTEPTRYNVPGKGKSVAIIGAGISGMACALRLATKKYNVTIYEKSDRIGGTLWDEIDPAIMQADFTRQMEHLNYTIKFNSEVTSIDDVIKQGYEDNKAAATAKASGVASVMRAHTTHGATDFTGTYDAIYIATGSGGNDFGIRQGASDSDNTASGTSGTELCALIGETAIFLGGSLVGVDKTHALADGLRISTAIDNYTLTKLLKYPEYKVSKIAIDETQYVETSAVKPAGDASVDDASCEDSESTVEYCSSDGTSVGAPLYSKEEAIEEAERCMKCQCNACRLHCDLTDYLHKWPLRLKDEIIATTAPGKSELHATPAVRTINMCTHCGLCKETCPEDIDLDGLIQSARVRMHKLDKMPWGFNDFFLRDMAFTNSDDAYVCLAPVGGVATCNADTDGPQKVTASTQQTSDRCEFTFFPGCQLGASSPELVLKSYELLQKINPSTGIMVGCCGVPAQWAGDEDLHESVIGKIRADWEHLGKPTMILACATCRKTFDNLLPEIKTTFIYDVIAKSDIAGCAYGSSAIETTSTDVACTSTVKSTTTKRIDDSSQPPYTNGAEYSVFDPCATSAEDSVRTSVRKICNSIGVKLTPLPLQEKWTACCSFGGQGDLADPDFTKYVREKRISEGELPYITYCINCRDAFLREGKEATHILELLFGLSPRLVTVTKRRQNRVELKDRLMKLSSVEATKAADSSDTMDAKFIGVAGKKATTDSADILLEMSEEVRQKLSDEYILEEEAADVVSFCERTGRTIHDTEADTYTGYRKIGNLTYWVTYKRACEVSSMNTDGVSKAFEGAEVSGKNTVVSPDAPRKYLLLNAYTHRMEIELEMIWNGEKIDVEI